jgi:signal transduction histidine kinase
MKTVDKMKPIFSDHGHELRTPLTWIKEGTSLLLEGGAESPIPEKASENYRCGKHRLIDGECLADLSKIEAGMMAFNFTPAEVSATSSGSAKSGPGPWRRGSELKCKPLPLPPVQMDTERILQVLRNLIAM